MTRPGINRRKLLLRLLRPRRSRIPGRLSKRFRHVLPGRDPPASGSQQTVRLLSMWVMGGTTSLGQAPAIPQRARQASATTECPSGPLKPVSYVTEGHVARDNRAQATNFLFYPSQYTRRTSFPIPSLLPVQLLAPSK